MKGRKALFPTIFTDLFCFVAVLFTIFAVSLMCLYWVHKYFLVSVSKLFLSLAGKWFRGEMIKKAENLWLPPRLLVISWSDTFLVYSSVLQEIQQLVLHFVFAGLLCVLYCVHDVQDAQMEFAQHRAVTSQTPQNTSLHQPPQLEIQRYRSVVCCDTS